MKYFLTEYVLKRSVTGTDLQTSMIPEYYKGKNYYSEIKGDVFPNFDPVVKLKLEAKAKFSDVIRISNFEGNGFLVSPRLKNLWADFNIYSSKYYPGTVSTHSEEREYFLFHMTAFDLKGIDYTKSVFHNYNKVIGEDEKQWPIFEEVNINNIRERITDIRELHLKKIYFNKYYPNFDLFYIPYFMVNANFFISQKLVDVMNKEKITGLAYHDQTFIDEF